MAQAGQRMSVRTSAVRGRLSGLRPMLSLVGSFGMSPVHYLQYLRVGKARESLEFSRLTVNEIAWRVGYQDPGSFRKVFQRIMGLSPRHYRRRFGVARDG
jgi:transcriptional regulator GlxA family with amidase domain